MATRPAAGGGRWLDVTPERLARWLDGFHDRHEVTATCVEDALVRFEASDGAVAECRVPFPPLDRPAGTPPGTALTRPGFDPAPLVTHALADRVVGVLLVRAGGHAAGVFEGSRLVASKVGSRQVQGRTAAGGWSQQRFRRRREGQLREAYSAAARDAAGVLVPHAGRLDALVLGGDRRGAEEVLTDPRLRPVAPLATERVLDVPDPRLSVLTATPDRFRAVRIRLLDPPAGT